MVSALETYSSASGASADIIEDYKSLKSSLPSASGNPLDSAIRVKEALFKQHGFRYDNKSFRIQDMLKNRTGNCLGFPLLIGCILSEEGIDLSFSLISGPRDKTYKLEQRYFQRLQEEVSYDNPGLIFERESDLYRFFPLEHLVLNVNGKLIETTTEEHYFPGCEYRRDITFDQAMGLILKDRAVETFYKRDLDEAKRLIEASKERWKNRSTFSLDATIGVETFDDFRYKTAIRDFLSLGETDSFFHYFEFQHGGNNQSLDLAIAKYPGFVDAMGCKAINLEKSNPKEARYLLALASHCVANSHLHTIPSFYLSFIEPITNLFGREKALKGLNSSDELIGDFDFNLELFHLTNDLDYLGEAGEAVETPFQKLRFAVACLETPFENLGDIKDLDIEFKESSLYKKIKKELLGDSMEEI